MSIPTYDKIMYPILEFASNGEHKINDAVKEMSDHFKLTEQERKELKPSGKGTLIKNRTGWAITYLVKAGLLERPKRGCFSISEKGLEYLKSNKHLSLKDLEQFPEYLDFKYSYRNKEVINKFNQEDNEVATPEELLEKSAFEIAAEVKSELLSKVIESTPEYLEIIIIQLLEKMGYGGEETEASLHLGKSGDEGVDGVIKQDKLGLELIYVQAKRYSQNNVVGRPAIQNFSGSLTGFNCQKGVFITTSSFSKQAEDYVKKIPQKIILIDGAKLADYMYEYNLGVRTVQTIEIKKIDEEYFIQE